MGTVAFSTRLEFLPVMCGLAYGMWMMRFGYVSFMS